jgi:hypothetical protein
MTTVIRASSLSRHADCPRRWAAQNIRREVEAADFKLRRLMRGIGALAGTATAVIAKVALTEKAKTGALPPLDTALDAGRDQLTADLQDGEIAFDRVTINRREAMRQVGSMGGMYHRTIAPKLTPVLVERRLEAEVEPNLILSGQADVIAHEPHGLRDLKTGQRPPAAFVQLGAYALLARSNRLDVETAAIDFIRRVPVTKPQPDPVTYQANIGYAEVAAVSILKHIATELRTFREGDPERRIVPGDPWAFPANPSSTLCGEKWCPCYGVTGPHAFCHEWQERW